MGEIKFAAEGVHPDARLRNEAEQGVHPDAHLRCQQTVLQVNYF